MDRLAPPGGRTGYLLGVGSDDRWGGLRPGRLLFSTDRPAVPTGRAVTQDSGIKIRVGSARLRTVHAGIMQPACPPTDVPAEHLGQMFLRML